MLASLNHKYVVRYYDCFIGAPLSSPPASHVAPSRFYGATRVASSPELAGLASRQYYAAPTYPARADTTAIAHRRCAPSTEGKLLNIVMSHASGGTIHHVIKVSRCFSHRCTTIHLHAFPNLG